MMKKKLLQNKTNSLSGKSVDTSRSRVSECFALFSRSDENFILFLWKPRIYFSHHSRLLTVYSIAQFMRNAFTMFLSICFGVYACKHHILNLIRRLVYRIYGTWAVFKSFDSRPTKYETVNLEPEVYLLQGSFALTTKSIDKAGEVYTTNITL